MELRNVAAFASPVIVAIASVALGGDSLATAEAWKEVAKQAAIIAALVVGSGYLASFVANNTGNDGAEKTQNFIVTFLTTGVFLSWLSVFVSRDGFRQPLVKDPRDINQIHATMISMSKASQKTFGKILATTVVGLILLLKS